MGRQSQRGLGMAGVGERGGKRGAAGLVSPYNCRPHGIAPRMRKWAHGSLNRVMNVTLSATTLQLLCPMCQALLLAKLPPLLDLCAQDPKHYASAAGGESVQRSLPGGLEPRLSFPDLPSLPV